MATTKVYRPGPIPRDPAQLAAYVQDELRRISVLRNESSSETSESNPTLLSVPSDYPTLQAAVDAAANFGAVEIRIESGHALTAGLLVRDGYFGHITITSEDATVPLHASFVGTDIGGDDGSDNIISAVNAVAPTLDCVIDADGAHGYGYSITGRSTGRVLTDCGVINAGKRGLHVRNGIVYAPGSIWSGAKWSGVFVTRASMADLQAAVADDCASEDTNGNGAVYCSRGSVLHFMLGSAQRSGTKAFRVHRSMANCTQANLSDAGEEGLFALQCAVVNASEAVIERSGTDGCFTNGGSTVNLHQALLRDSVVKDLRLSRGSIVTLEETLTTTNSIADVAGVTAFNIPTGSGLVMRGSTILLGDPDSGGAGYRVLRVANS